MASLSGRNTPPDVQSRTDALTRTRCFRCLQPQRREVFAENVRGFLEKERPCVKRHPAQLFLMSGDKIRNPVGAFTWWELAFGAHAQNEQIVVMAQPSIDSL